MNTKILDGKTLRRMLIGAAETIRENIDFINELNVFPVPDGDTGTNMTKTMEGGISEISEMENPTVSTVSCKFARGSLLGARGNSGVILSQIFAGIEEELSKYDVATARDFARAFASGTVKAYSSVMNPTEGTILTVFREATEYASQRIDKDSTIEDFLSYHIEEGKRSLERTKEILPALTEADVVDSGGAGYLCIASGMYAALTGERSFDAYRFSSESTGVSRDGLDAFTRDSTLTFGYCTEVLIRLQSAKVDPDTFDVAVMTDYLEKIGAGSVVAYKTGDIVKLHAHTENPGNILNEFRKYGEFLTVKIENMALQHNESIKKPKPKKRKPFATLAVATGDGICELFRTIGADAIVSGGQTSNPSAEEFLAAFRECEADEIIVLPNNKNVFLTAKQASELYGDAKIHIIPTETLMQGYAALQVITPGVETESLIKSATDAARGAVDGEITYAVRDATVGGVEVKRDEYMAISASKIVATGKSAREALLGMLESVEDMDFYEIISVFAGVDVTDDERASLAEELEELYPDHEITVYTGGQEVYSYLVAIE